MPSRFRESFVGQGQTPFAFDKNKKDRRFGSKMLFVDIYCHYIVNYIVAIQKNTEKWGKPYLNATFIRYREGSIILSFTRKRLSVSIFDTEEVRGSIPLAPTILLLKTSRRLFEKTCIFS